MLFVIVLVVVVVAAAGAGLLGVGVLSEANRRRRSGMLAVVSAPVVLLVGVGLLAVVALGLGGAVGPEPEEAGPGEVPRITATSRPPSAGVVPLPLARLEPVTTNFPVVAVRPADENRFSPYLPVSGLAPGSVIRVRAEGFGEFERGQAEQCVSELGHQTACIGGFPVQFDEDGKADFQFAVLGDFAPGGCRAGQPTCFLRLTGSDSGRRGTAQTVLVDRVEPGRVTVEPARGLVDGQTVVVSVSGFAPGTTAAAVLCAPPDAYDARRCGPAMPTSTFVVGADGAGRTTLVVAAGRLGPDSALCGPRRLCGVSVVVGSGFVTAPATPVEFSLGPGVAYEADRLVPGIGMAIVLVALAVVIARRTDWTKPTEAASPALDRADLRSDQDLDELFGTDEELDERDPILW